MSSGSKDDAAKRRRLTSLGKKSLVSARGLEGVLNAVKKNGLPDSFSRSTQYRYRKESCSLETPYGKLVVPIELPMQTIGIQNPLAMLYHQCASIPSFAALLRASLQAKRPSPQDPWTIILYADEVSPGDPLRGDRRKSWAVYWSFAEFGLEVLGSEEAWFTLCCVRANLVSELDGGISHLVKLVLARFFGASHNIGSGIILDFEGNDDKALLFATSDVLLADEPALAAIICAKGASGTKPCMLCKNVVGSRAHYEGGYAVPLTCTDVSKFKMHTDASVKSLFKTLGDLRDDSTFALKETLWGFKFSDHSIILSELPFKPISGTMFDWMHIYLVGGIMNWEIGWLMHHMKRNGSNLTYEALGDYMETWTMPKSAPPVDVFSPTAAKKHDTACEFKISASEGLTLYPILAHYLLHETGLLAPEDRPKIESASSLFEVLDLLQNVKRNLVTPAELHRGILKHLRSQSDAWGDVMVKPKHHQALHLASMLKKWGWLLACFVHERKHKSIKRFTKLRQFTGSFEQGAIEDITIDQLESVRSFDFLSHEFRKARSPYRNELLMLREVFPNCDPASIQLSSEVCFGNGRISVGDAVLIKMQSTNVVGELFLNVKVQGQLLSIVSLWEVAGAAASSIDFVIRHRPELIDTASLLCSLVYRMDGVSRATVLIPPMYRT